MAITQAAADGDATEASEREEANAIRSQGNDLANEAAGSDNGRMVLAGVCAQSGVNHAPTDRGQGQALRPLLVPTEAYPLLGNAGSPINVDEYHLPIDVDQFNGQSPNNVHDSSPTPGSLNLNFFESHSPVSV